MRPMGPLCIRQRRPRGVAVASGSGGRIIGRAFLGSPLQPQPPRQAKSVPPAAPWGGGIGAGRARQRPPNFWARFFSSPPSQPTPAAKSVRPAALSGRGGGRRARASAEAESLGALFFRCCRCSRRCCRVSDALALLLGADVPRRRFHASPAAPACASGRQPTALAVVERPLWSRLIRIPSN